MSDRPTCATECGCAVAVANGPAPAGRRVSRIEVPGMDCPGEGEQVRACLDGLATGLEFDYPARVVRVWHEAPPEAVCARIRQLGFGGRLLASEVAAPDGSPVVDERRQRRVLWTLLAINAAMFVVEGVLRYWTCYL